MFYSEEIIDEVISRNDIVDIVSSYVKLTKKGSSYFGLCPFHNEKTASFSVSKSKQMYYCFGCGAGGSVITFVMQYENISFPEALKMLADRAGVKLPEYEPTQEEKERRDKKTTLLEINRIAANFYHAKLKSTEGTQGLDYLKKRELLDDTIVHFGLGYSGKTSGELYMYLKSKGYNDSQLKDSGLVTIEENSRRDKFWNRVMFPILDVNNRVIGFGGRVMGDGEPKYLNSPETVLFDKSRNLYGLNFARTSRKDYLLLCEGYMDVIALQQAGLTNSVASLGTALTTQHAMLIKRYVNKVVLSYDSDDAGIHAAQRAIPLFRQVGVSVRVLNMKPYKDPDDFIKNLGCEEYKKRIENAQNAFLWSMEILKKNYKLDDPEQKTSYYKEIAKNLTAFTETLERDNYMQAICKQENIPYEEMRRMVSGFGERIVAPTRSEDFPSLKTKKKEKDDGLLKSQRMLLTWMIDSENLYNQIKEYISPDDFSEELYREVALKVYHGRESGNLNPPSILTAYIDDADKQNQVAQILNTDFNDVTDEVELKKAIAESIVKVKKASLETSYSKATTLEQMQDILRAQADLNKKNIVIL